MSEDVLAERRVVTRDELAKALQRVEWPAGWWSGREVNESLSRQADAIFAALVRTPETLDVERVVIEMEHEGVVTWGDERHRDRFLAATSSPTPPEGLSAWGAKPILSFEGDDAGPLGHSHLWFCQCSDLSIPRHSCAASPAPDPGAGLREAAQDLIDYLDGGGFRANFPDGHFDRLRAALAPSAEPPETETT